MKVELTNEEALLLDGKVGQEAQKKVELAKDRICLAGRFPDVPHAWFLADVKMAAEEAGALQVRYDRLMVCPLCKESYTYAKYKGTGRYHKKGDPNKNRPILLPATMFGAGVFCCSKCWEGLKPTAAEVLADAKAEIPKAITGADPKWKRWDNMTCSKCSWEGHEGQMGRLRTLMGDGTYAGKCPECGAENAIFGISYITRTKPSGFTIVPA